MSINLVEYQCYVDYNTRGYNHQIETLAALKPSYFSMVIAIASLNDNKYSNYLL